MDWLTPSKPAELTESQLIDAILDDHFSIGSLLPAERELAAKLGVTRPTLREALQRLARDGWIEIHQGRQTRVKDYWHEGNLGVLGYIAHRPEHLPEDFVPNLLYIRELLAPAYTRLAIENCADELRILLENSQLIADNSEAFSEYDWNLHHFLTITSGNPIFTLILNGFCDLYHTMARIYFNLPESREHSRRFYTNLYQAALKCNAEAAEILTKTVMQESLFLWQKSWLTMKEDVK